MALSKTTQDHDEIKAWAEKRGGKPADVESTETASEAGIIRLEFPDAPNANDANLKEIDWEPFFEKFDKSGLAMVYQEVTSDGAESNFYKFVHPENLSVSAKKSVGKKVAGKAVAKKTAPAKKVAAKKAPVAVKSSAKKVGTAEPKKVAATKAAKSVVAKTVAKKSVIVGKETAAKKTVATSAAKAPAKKTAKVPAKKIAAKKVAATKTAKK